MSTIPSIPFSTPGGRPPIVTLLTDFGTADWYVAAMKAVILRRVPECCLVDITHEVPSGAIATGSFHLTAVTSEFPAGTVHLAVVDPGVGSTRRRIAVRYKERFFVGPDNGLLEHALEGAEVRLIEREDLLGARQGRTFDGRDRFAPAAAALADGVAFESLGAIVTDPIRLPGASPERSDEEIRGRVLHVDRFGNAITNLPTEWLDAVRTKPGTFVRLEDGQNSLKVRLVGRYSDLAPGEAGLLPSSIGTLEFALRDRSFADRWPAVIKKEIFLPIR